MQTAKATEAQGFCRDEFQAYMKEFVNPLMQKTLHARFVRERQLGARAPKECGGQRFVDVYKDWRLKLQSCYELLNVAGTPIEADRWQAWPNVPLSAYVPTSVPYFVTIDRSTAHSFWLDTQQKVHVLAPGTPIMQIVRMPPHGHDLHQIAEHAIGTGKGHTHTKLSSARANALQLTTKLAHNAMIEGVKLYTKESWASNLDRLMTCLAIVAAPESELLTVSRTTKSGILKQKTVKGTAGGYCPKQWS